VSTKPPSAYTLQHQVDGDVNNNAEALTAFADSAISIIQDGLVRVTDAAESRAQRAGAAARATAEALADATGRLNQRLVAQVGEVSPRLAQLLQGGGDRVEEGLARVRGATLDADGVFTRAQRRGEVSWSCGTVGLWEAPAAALLACIHPQLPTTQAARPPPMPPHTDYHIQVLTHQFQSTVGSVSDILRSTAASTADTLQAAQVALDEALPGPPLERIIAGARWVVSF